MDGPMSSRRQLVESNGKDVNGEAAKQPMAGDPLLERKIKNGISFQLVLGLFAAVWGSVEFGWNIGVVNNPKEVITSFINATETARTGTGFDQYTLDNIFSWLVVSAFTVGGMIGGLLAGIFADKLGRRRGMLLNAGLGIIGALLMGLAQPVGSYELIIVGRFVIGFCSGLYTGLVPVYLSEIAPLRLRGAAGVLNQLGVVTGLLVSQILGLDTVLGTETLWPLLMSMAGLPCLLQLVFLPLSPESPRYLLITQRRREDARDALVRLRGHANVEEEIQELVNEASKGADEPEVKMSKFCSEPALRTPLLIGIVMHLSQQLSGIGVIFTYSNTVFSDAGLSPAASGYATLGVGGIMVAMTIVTVPLMDRAGRRPLHLTGLMGILICSIGFTIFFRLQPLVSWFAYPSVVLALLVVVFFALGPGSIPWMIMPELFGQGARSKAVAIGVGVNWTANFLVAALFPMLQKGLGRLLFLPFSVITLLCFVFLALRLPETKNKPIEEIVAIFEKPSEYGGLNNGTQEAGSNAKTQL